MATSRIRMISAVALLAATVTLPAGVWIYQAVAGSAGEDRKERPSEAAVAGQSSPEAGPLKNDERTQLQGVWVATSAIVGGRAAPPERLKDAQLSLTISGSRFRLKPGMATGWMQGLLKIDTDAQPPAMDWGSMTGVASSAPDAQVTSMPNVLAIYKLEGDMLTLCYAPERPTKFESSPDRKLDQRLYVFQRQKAQTDELKRLQGVWIPTSAVSARGKPAPPEVLRQSTLTIDGNTVISQQGAPDGIQGWLTIDPTSNPATMDWDTMRSTKEGGRTFPNQLAIYRLEGDTLTICEAAARPTKFDPPDGRLVVFKRKKP